MVQVIDRPPSFGEQVGRGLGTGFSKGLGDRMQEESSIRQQKSKLAGEYEADQGNYGRIEKAFGKNFAQVWLASPQGARTELTRAALEAKSRGIDLDQIIGGIPGHEEFTQQQPSSQQQPQEEAEPEKQVEQQLGEYLEEQDEGLLPAEKIKRGQERFSTGLKPYQEAGEKLRGMTRDKERLDILESLNKTDKLPKNLGRLNVDKEGNLRLPFASNPETQRYVKVLNEFSSGAKESFGSRVTNFDLAQYMKRYPTLLNTEEGRNQLLKQMKIVNQINAVHYKNLKNVYDKAGGVRNIDADVAERLAEQLSEAKVTELSKKFSEIGQFESLPSAAEFKGKKIRDKETGEILVSDGNDWLPAE